METAFARKNLLAGTKSNKHDDGHAVVQLLKADNFVWRYHGIIQCPTYTRHGGSNEQSTDINAENAASQIPE